MKTNIKTNNSGIALILVLGILAVLAVLATTFAFNTRLEQKAASNYLDAVKADCIARMGVEHAIALLHDDLTGSTAAYDWNGDTWGYLDDGDSIFGAYEDGGDYYHEDLDSYEHTCTPGYNGKDAQWIGIRQDGVLVGRYAVLVTDESSKMNINCAGNIADGGNHGYNEGWTTAEIDLAELPDISSTDAENIVKYRYGLNELPGDGSVDDDEANKGILEYDDIDNDGDGSPPDELGEGDDEPDEFTPWYPRDDDNPFSTISQIKRVTGIGSTTWDNVKNLVTVHSRTRNQYWDGSDWEPKLNINAVADVSELSTLLSNAPGGGVLNPKQKACNIIDYRDENIILSSIDSAGWYYGIEPILINEVLANSYHTDSYDTGDLDAINDSHTYGGLAPNTCYRVTIDTSTYDNNPAPGQFTVTIGVTTETVTSDPYDFTSISDCISTPGGQLQITFTDTSPIADGEESRVVGVMFTCAEFVELCNISSGDGDKDGFNGINLTNWTITVGSKTSTIPAGVYNGGSTNVIDPGSYFILTNDVELFDYSYGAIKNGTWGNADEDIPVADMSSIGINPWVPGALKWNTPGELGDPGEGTIVEDIILTDKYGLITERAVNADRNSNHYGFSSNIGVSREKDDPTDRDDWADNGKLTAQASPAINSITNALNDRVNSGAHTDLSELYIKNYPFASIGEMSDYTNYEGVRSGDADWDEATYFGVIHGDLSTDDLGLIAERITVNAVRLDAETADVINTGFFLKWVHTGNGSQEPYLTESYRANSILDWGDWEWKSARLQQIPHILYVYGLYINDNNYLSAGIWNYEGNGWDAFKTNLEYEPSDGLGFPVKVTKNNISSDGSFKIGLIVTKNPSDDVYFDYLLLVPQSSPGKINVNTAALQVLKALPGLNAAQAEAIYNTVHNAVVSPYDTPYEKLGDVLGATGIGAAEFSAISNLITVHSDVFKIICLAQTIQDMDPSTYYVDDPSKVVLAEKKIEVIVDRSALPSGPIRILSWKEITE